MGRLSEEKGVYTLLQAFVNNGLKLVIAGTGPLSEEVTACSLKYNNITYLGQVDKTKANQLLAGANALIFPSLWFETFGMVIIEAFALGTPVIASKLGQLEFTITHQYNGLHFEPGNDKDLQEKIGYYEHLTLPERSGYQRNALKSYFDNYTPEKNLTLLLAVYNAAINKTQPGKAVLL